MADLFEVVDAANSLGRLLRTRQGRQEHRREDCDDRNYNQELNECESIVDSRFPISDFKLAIGNWQSQMSEKYFTCLIVVHFQIPPSPCCLKYSAVILPLE
jgi:hypothetical protein